MNGRIAHLGAWVLLVALVGVMSGCDDAPDEPPEARQVRRQAEARIEGILDRPLTREERSMIIVEQIDGAWTDRVVSPLSEQVYQAMLQRSRPVNIPPGTAPRQ